MIMTVYPSRTLLHTIPSPRALQGRSPPAELKLLRKKAEEIYQMVYTWRRGPATQSAVSLSRPFAFARTGAPRTPFSPLWWGWIRLEPTAVNICANFFPSKNCAHICEKVCGNCFNPKFCRNNCAQIYAFLCNANFCKIFWENTCGK